MVVKAPQARQMVVAAPQAQQMVVAAPQARQMVARGEREARSPWNVRKRSTGLEGRQKRARVSVAPAGLARFLSVIQGQRARGAPTCPWLPSAAPAALRTLRAPPAALRNPGYLLPRLRRFGTLATFCRACGASEPWLPSSAPAALRNPGYHLPRLRRFGTLRAPPARTNNDVNFRDRTLAPRRALALGEQSLHGVD
jgi:hypothetical protein